MLKAQERTNSSAAVPFTTEADPDPDTYTVLDELAGSKAIVHSVTEHATVPLGG